MKFVDFFKYEKIKISYILCTLNPEYRDKVEMSFPWNLKEAIMKFVCV
jgi:hypothetical protein